MSGSMSFILLGELGAIQCLNDAISVIEKNGYTSVVAYDPYDHKFGLVGALAHAMGASVKDMKPWDGSLSDAPINDPKKYALFLELVSFLEGIVSNDIDFWCLDSTKEDAIETLDKAVRRIEISVV
jgi:hypothetical protein